MSDAVSALGGAQSLGPVRVSEMPLQGMVTLRGDLSARPIIDAFTAIAGTPMPGRREVCVEQERGLIWMSPDELLLLCPYAQAQAVSEELTETLAGTHSLAVNVSDARALFRIEGPRAREVVARLAPVDMRPAAMPAGVIRRTRLSQVAAAFWIEPDDSIRLICFRSVAGYVFDLLSNASSGAESLKYFR